MSGPDPIFDAYVAELRDARDVALAWWTDLLARASSDPIAAEAAVRPRWPAGPVSHPRVIAVYRKYHLIYEREREGDAPYFALVERVQLLDKTLGDFIAGLLFVPVGTDDNGDPA